MTKKITFLDKTFWMTESKNNPKHVASLQLLDMPDDAADDYVDNLYQEMRQFDYAKPPFNCRVSSFLKYPYKLTPLEHLDMDYHLQCHQIADINDKPALHLFTAKLHEALLDRDKPLWQYHFIKDNKSTRYGIYAKVHHMYGDGATLLRWFQAGYVKDRSTADFVPVWAIEQKRRKRPQPNIASRFFSGLWGCILTLKDLCWIFFRLLLKLLHINTVYMPIPFSGTKTVLTGQVKSGRVVSTLDMDFARIKTVGRRARASANEILLCAFDIGVHRFLQDYGHTFDKALYTNMPINLRKPGEQTVGNKIAIVPVRLAYGKKDPYLRLRQIIENHRIVKHAAKASYPASFSYYTLLIQSWALLFEALHMSDWVRPIANILISNVPGPSEQRYLKDSTLVACYPISTMTPGGGVSITLITYNGTANVGIVCCNNNIESLEPLSQYFHEAFDMLEACLDDTSLNIDDIGEHKMDDTKPIDELSYDEEEAH